MNYTRLLFNDTNIVIVMSGKLAQNTNFTIEKSVVFYRKIRKVVRFLDVCIRKYVNVIYLLIKMTFWICQKLASFVPKSKFTNFWHIHKVTGVLQCYSAICCRCYSETKKSNIVFNVFIININPIRTSVPYKFLCLITTIFEIFALFKSKKVCD